MSKTVRHCPDPKGGIGLVSLEPGIPLPLTTGGVLAVFVDLDADAGYRTLRFELAIQGVRVSAFGLAAGFTAQALGFGWAITHHTTTFDDNGSVLAVSVVIH